ncbi:hypothetical protein LTR56_007827 [Elasticomyces elasticus]|nr:hypothetical protein LTR56_007827 [Elasticomyces elasticus]KAK3667876.1 hypothetical protein LTR22_001321 [Elasticomyces elasticus]KAK5763489.1 hypothetical protein LTS12_006460 [Elasticomyces elasticus]
MPPLLPNEIWQRVFTFAANDDKVALWMNGRRSCRAWKSNIERAFCDNYLKDATRFTIDFDCGVQSIPHTENGCKCFLAVEMVFDRVDNSRGGSFCVFSESLETTGQPPNLGKEEWNQITLRRNISRYLGADAGASTQSGRFDRPPWVILLACSSREDEYWDDDRLTDEHMDESETINDTELPGFAFDVETHEISFDWILAFSKFFAEAAELAKRDKVSERNVKDCILARVGALDSNGYMVARSGTDPKDFTRLLIEGVRIAKGGSRENRKQIRRERITRFYKDRFGVEYKDENFGSYEREALRQFTTTADPFSILAELSLEEEEEAGAGRDDMGEMSGGEHGFEGICSDVEDGEDFDDAGKDNRDNWNDDHRAGDDPTSQTPHTYSLVAPSTSKTEPCAGDGMSSIE